jgi:hypothetical protein
MIHASGITIRETKLYALIGDGDLPAYKLGDQLVFRPDDVGRLIAALPPAKIKPIRQSRRRRIGISPVVGAIAFGVAAILFGFNARDVAIWGRDEAVKEAQRELEESAWEQHTRSPDAKE